MWGLDWEDIGGRMEDEGDIGLGKNQGNGGEGEQPPWGKQGNGGRTCSRLGKNKEMAERICGVEWK